MFIVVYLLFSPKQKDEKCDRNSYSYNLFESFFTKKQQGKNNGQKTYLEIRNCAQSVNDSGLYTILKL